MFKITKIHSIMILMLLFLTASLTMAADNVANKSTDKVSDKPVSKPKSKESDRSLDIGNQRQLFIDDYLISKQENVELLVHHPDRKELTFIFDQPWEGDGQNYFTVFQDDQKYRMYYHAW